MAKFHGKGPQITDLKQPQYVDKNCTKVVPFLFQNKPYCAKERRWKVEKCEVYSATKLSSVSLLNPIPQRYYFPKKLSFSSA